MVKSVLIGIRLEEELLKKIDSFAKEEGTNRSGWIKMAISDFVNEVEAEIESNLIQDFVQLRIDEERLKNGTGLKKIPKDVYEARKRVLDELVEKKRR